jgi:hypothetical protein
MSMSLGTKAYSQPTRIFRSVRAGIVYKPDELGVRSVQAVLSNFANINVEFIDSGRLFEHSGDNNFGIMGILGERALEDSRDFLNEIDCLKIGFYTEGNNLESIRKSLRHLNACILCHGFRKPQDALGNTIFHFYESLTLPSLLNIDLADVQSIAKGIGISFNVAGNSSREIVSKLPKESYVARSALLHFACKTNVTLEEVYRVSKAVSVKKTAAAAATLYARSSYKHSDVKKVYKRINIKMGLRVVEGLGSNENPSPRISLTAILFGI